MIPVVALLLVAALLSGCGSAGDAVSGGIESAAGEAGSALNEAGIGLDVAATTFALELNDAVSIEQDPLPPPPPPPRGEPADPAIDLIVRWEVISRSYFEKALRRPICPPGASGPTAGIGYDFGHQTKSEIRRVWGWHQDVDALVAASGQTGAERCKAWRATYPSVRVGWDDAIRVFRSDSLPRYRALAEAALPGLAGKTTGHNSGLTSTGYRRGWSMEGQRNIEKRVIRSRCMPIDSQESSAGCSAEQVIAMCRIWANTNQARGQCNRSHDEARVIRS